MKRFRRILMGLCVVMLALGLGCGCSAPHKKDAISIGGILTLSGEWPLYGMSASKGIRLATKQVNDTGGILGKPINYIELDDKGECQTAEDACKQLQKERVLGIIGTATTRPALGLVQEAKKSGLPIISPTATAADITSYGDNLFRVCYIDPYQNRVLASFVCEELGAKKIAVLYEHPGPHSGGSAQEFSEKAAMLGVSDITFEAFAPGDPDLTPQLLEIKKANPDVLFAPTNYHCFVRIAEQARQLGITAVLVGNDSAEGALVSGTPAQKQALEGVYFSIGYFPMPEDEKSMAFYNAFVAEYKEEPDSFAALGYDAAMLMYSSIKKAGQANSKQVIRQINHSQSEGVTGPINLNCLGDPLNKRIFIMKISGGQKTLHRLIAPELEASPI